MTGKGEDSDFTMINGTRHRKLTKNEKRRQRKKSEKTSEVTSSVNKLSLNADVMMGDAFQSSVEDLDIEYVTQDISSLIQEAGFGYSRSVEFKNIFEKFERSGREEIDNDPTPTIESINEKIKKEETVKSEETTGKKPSRKSLKLKNRLSVAELKQKVARPDVVEAHDVTSADPKLLVYLKSYRNTVPVPRHWCHKRKYLQGKRGIEKKPFELPDFISMTGIAKLRDNAEELDSAKKAKQRMRERVQPKMGSVNIDYQVLHDAFFKWQKKPRMTIVGDLYYEGKEFETRLREKKPGQLSDELKIALGMPEGAPPPWLINMQRYGPPPSYPHLRIPGLNAPIPPGASFGYQPGGWGKPPVNEAGVPLYGDVFGTMGVEEEQAAIDKSHWGELKEEESSEEEGGDEDVDMANAADEGQAEVPPTPLDGAESSLTAIETPDALLDLRKRGLETPSEIGTPAPKELYTVIGETATGVGGALFGTDKKYKIGKNKVAGIPDVQVSINPDELEAQLEDTEGLRDRYEATLESIQPEREDVSDILAEETRKRKRKLEKGKDKGSSKKTKEFKF